VTKPRGQKTGGGTARRDGLPQPVEIPISDVFDLHAFAPRDVRDAVEAYLEEAQRQGLTALRIIHGRGIGVQRETVRKVLERTPWVVDYRDAPAEAGGWGATIVTLRAARPSDH
jgi:dsDNA-specific endonuclease/ATPase MutS2